MKNKGRFSKASIECEDLLFAHAHPVAKNEQADDKVENNDLERLLVHDALDGEEFSTVCAIPVQTISAMQVSRAPSTATHKL